MARNNSDRGQEVVMFESVGIGPSGGEPVEFVPVDVTQAAPATSAGKGRLGVAVAVGLAVLIAAILWVSTRSSTPESIGGWEPRLPTDPSLAFEWTGPNSDEHHMIVAGSADSPYVLTIGSSSGTIFALDESGGERWHADVGGGYYGGVYQSGGTIVAVTHNIDRFAADAGETGDVVVTGLDPATGERRWQTSAPGQDWHVVDNHVAVLDYPDGAETIVFSGDDEDTVEYPPVAFQSIAMDSGERSDPQRFETVLSSGDGADLLVQRDGEVFTIDAALNPTSAAVPAGNWGAGVDDDGTIMTVDADTVTLYDKEGAEIRSAAELPDGLEANASWSVVGAGSDLWLYTVGTDTLDCGVLRFSENDDVPIDLWRAPDCYLFEARRSDQMGPGADDQRWYGYRYAFGPIGDDHGFVDLVDLATGETLASGGSIDIGSNGIVMFDGDQVIGTSLTANGRKQRLFVLPATAEDWRLIGGAIAIAAPAVPGEPRTVSIYR